MKSLLEAQAEKAKREKARRSFLDYNYHVCPEGEEPVKHHGLLCDVGQKLVDGYLKRIMIFLPPGSAKSTYFSVRLPAFYISKTLRKGVITASYADSLSTSFGRKVRNLVNSIEHQQLFDTKLAQDSKAKGEWETEDQSFYYACGVGGSVTGRRADFAIIDDPVRSRKDADSETVRQSTWEWYLSDLKTRLKPDASIAIIMTRWHEDDLAGRILPEDYAGESGIIDCRDGQQWYVLNIPAQARAKDALGRKKDEWLWTDWFTKEFWESTKAEQTTRNWNSLFQGMPTADDGSFYKRKDFNKRWSILPNQLEFFAAGDFALTEDGGDYTEIGIFGVDSSRNIYVADWFTGQVESKTWISEMFRLHKKWGFNWLAAEPGQIKKATESTILENMRIKSQFFGLKYIGGGNSKEANAGTFQNLQSSGRVFWPEAGYGSTPDHKKLVEITDRVIEQLIKAFGGRYDDAIDTTSCFGLKIIEAWNKAKPEEKPIKQREIKTPALTIDNLFDDD